MSRSTVETRIGLLTGADLSEKSAGGTAAYVLGLARFLASRGIGVDLISNGPVVPLPRSCAVFPVSPRHVPSTREFHTCLARIARKLPLEEVDVLHLQRPDDLWSLRRVTNLPPAVCTLHGDVRRSIRLRRGRVAAGFYRYVEARVLRRFRALIAVSAATASVYSSRYPSLAKNIMTIPTAADERWDGIHESGRRGERTEMTVLYAGRLSAEKRVDQIISLFRRSGALGNAHLLVAGSGPEEPWLRRLARGARIDFLGIVPHGEMPSLYAKVDAVVLASDFEGTPTVALEALACGCPVAALESCGVTTEMSNGGVFVARSVEDLPASLKAAANRKHAAPRLRLAPTYTWPVVGQDILRVYQQVVPALAAFSGCQAPMGV